MTWQDNEGTQQFQLKLDLELQSIVDERKHEIKSKNDNISMQRLNKRYYMYIYSFIDK